MQLLMIELLKNYLVILDQAKKDNDAEIIIGGRL